MTPDPMASRRLVPWLLLLPAATALGFAFYTGQIWEDFLITFRHSQNLVEGNGLVYYPGERVHGFTSVLNTLLPVLPYWAFGTMEASLWFFRLCSLAVLLVGLFFLWSALASRHGAGRSEFLLQAGLAATSIKIVAFTMNGQETGLLVGFLALALAMALRLDEAGAWRRLGLAWAGLLYTRPDSPLYIGLVAFIAWAVGTHPFRQLLRPLSRAALLAGAAFLPWLIFAWAYYGSPVPHTVVAKAAPSVFVEGNVFQTLVEMAGSSVAIVADVFGPVYGMSHWPDVLALVALAAGAFAALYWALPIPKDRLAWACSISLAVTLVYLAWVETQRLAYPWYFGAATLFAVVVIGRAAAQGWSGSHAKVRGVAAAGAGAVVLACLGIFVLSHEHLRLQQLEVEERIRKPVGLWLAEHGQPSDTVFLEPIGYIGYYSRMHIVDYPGLVSPATVRARRETGEDFTKLPLVLKPTWMVLRGPELELLRPVPEILRDYELAATFDKAPEILQRYQKPFPGSSGILYDSQFVILRRKPGAP